MIELTLNHWPRNFSFFHQIYSFHPERSMMALIFLFIWLLRLDISIALWNLSAIPWYCDRHCYSMINKTEISNAGCLERLVKTNIIL